MSASLSQKTWYAGITMATKLAAAVSLILLAVLPTAAHAGKRVSPVSPRCPAEAPSKEIDAEGKEDRCASRMPPTCKTGMTLAVDAAGEADRCMPEGKAGKGDSPNCPPQLKLHAKSGPDSCERVDKPQCPDGFKLKVMSGEDMCTP
jgi:hypothetical protein